MALTEHGLVPANEDYGRPRRSALAALDDLDTRWPGPPPARTLRTCRECGCTEHNGCYQPDLGYCGWAKQDLCSHCVPRVQARSWRRRFWILLASIVAFSGLCMWVGYHDAHVIAEPGPVSMLQAS